MLIFPSVLERLDGTYTYEIHRSNMIDEEIKEDEN